MSGSQWGHTFRIQTFGESHGEAIGVVIDGCPAGLEIDESFIQEQMDRRRPGQSKITTQRKESDHFEILSGVFENKTLGTPLCAIVRNADARSEDYDHLKNNYRPSHADFTTQHKYGIRDHRGGGRSSARETVARVWAGAVAQLFLKQHQISIHAWVSQVGSITWDEKNPSPQQLQAIDSNLVRCPDNQTSKLMQALIEDVKKQGDTVGGCVRALIQGLPVGLGQPVFDKLHADLAKAMLSINAAKGFEYGSGFAGACMKGSQHNDLFINENEKIKTQSNHSGGIQGGLSNGMDVYFQVAFKPVATLLQTQETVDGSGHSSQIKGRGRHDPCVLPRAVPIVEAMAALTIADHLLRSRTDRL